MSETGKTIKVVDRRLFTAEGEIRDEVKAELAAEAEAEAKAEAKAEALAEAQAGSRAEAPPEREEEPAAEPPTPTDPAFLRLLDMLGQTASLYLEGMPDPATGRRTPDLAGARHIIDSLASLKAKTLGRLSFEEADAIDGMLGELQLVFTRLAAAMSGKGRAPGIPGMPPPPSPRRG